MDRYSTGSLASWHYRDAVRGSDFVLADVTVSSPSHNPMLPAIAVYRLESGSLRHIGQMHYEFYRWRDYGSYLGNYSDYGNDFAHTRAVRFAAGVELPEAALDGAPIFVLASKTGCHVRTESRYGSPEVEYQPQNCSVPDALDVSNAQTDFSAVGLLNRSLLR